MAAERDTAYRLVRLRLRDRGPDLWASVAAGWDLACSMCGAVNGRLFMPFSGGFILAGSTSHLDRRVVERSGPENVTGHRYRRYGPPTRVFAEGRTERDIAGRPELVVHGPFWLYCHACNAGQAVEPDRVNSVGLL